MKDEEKRGKLRQLRQEREAFKSEFRTKVGKMTEAMYAFCEQNGGHHIGATDAYGDGNCEDCGMGMSV